MNITPQQMIEYWYSDRIKNRWFSSTPALDQEILQNYKNIWEKASNGELNDWADEAMSSLALIIILDQLPLNMFRGQEKSFKTEKQAVKVALNAINKSFHKQIEKDKLLFLYMPLMHSENIIEQDLSVKYYKALGIEGNFKFAKHHREIIRKFGRFPHRNKILGRTSTEEEIKYLAGSDAFTG